MCFKDKDCKECGYSWDCPHSTIKRFINKVIDKNKYTLSNIDNSTIEGRLLIMALSKLTGTIYSHKTPDEVIRILVDMANSMEWQ